MEVLDIYRLARSYKMYKQFLWVDGTIASSIIRIEDNAYIPFDPANTDYIAYLAWLAEGNTPEEA